MQLIQDLEATRDETLRYFGLPETDLNRTYGEGKWSIRFILHHLADSETVLYERIRRILSEERPVLWAFDADEWEKGLDYAALPLHLSRALFESTRNAILHYAARSYEKDGDREWVHSKTGVRTLRQELDKVAAHNANHLRQIRRALGKE